MSTLRTWLQAKIDEVTAWPDHVIDDTGEYEYQTGPDDLEYFGYLVREAFVSAASSGFVQPPPEPLLRRHDAIYYLRQVASWLDHFPDEPVESPITHDGPYSVREAAAITRISERKLYQACSDGLIRHRTNPIRIPRDALDEYERQREHGTAKTSGFRHLT
ncbi:MAG: helix-turn-helix domain-containing protein [Planctomycetales bacterium]|nr:helix-turn-helix domain-containing protein [Planctomycetales bacterium]